MKRTLMISLGVGAVLTMTQTLHAQSANCAPRPNVVTQLNDRFGESRQSIGMAQGNRVVEMFASAETGTWTITVTLPDGRMCVIASGQSFETVEDEVATIGEPT